ncbi:MAG: RNA polymerase sigma factor [Bacteroidales bacterium]|nr:RNA polymerase sigma factor [Bacteroidales bacterium]
MFRRISDSTIVDGIRRQDDQILNWLYDNYLETVRHHVLRNSGSESDVPDVFQESIITLYRQITSDGFTLTTDLKGYFYGIARNIWNVQLRRRMRHTGIDHDYPDNEEGDDPDLLLESIVNRAFRKLSDDAQTILSMFSEGFSYPEIAAKMNLKNETYARRKKYLSKEALIELVKSDPEYKDYLDFR